MQFQGRSTAISVGESRIYHGLRLETIDWMAFCVSTIAHKPRSEHSSNEMLWWWFHMFHVLLIPLEFQHFADARFDCDSVCVLLPHKGVDSASDGKSGDSVGGSASLGSILPAYGGGRRISR